MSTLAIFEIIFLCVVVIMWHLMKRNNQVHEERYKLFHKIPPQYWEFFDEVKYDTMLYRFWKPTNSFFNDWITKKRVEFKHHEEEAQKVADSILRNKKL